jgi:BirA family biotin operon repressor/biotin-[acetyl-CoA-carboxylase] ligase
MASRNSSKASSSQIKRGATTLYDKMTDIEVAHPNIYWFDELESTMVKARELIDDNKDRDSFAVVAGHQSAGRGTRGRTWVSGSGNLFLTVVLRLSSIPAPLTLIPLR